MDPQKLPDNTPKDNKDMPSTDSADNGDVSMSEESSATPGTVVVGGQTSEASTPDPSSSSTTPVPPAPIEQPLPEFMREPGDSDTPPAPPASGGKKTGLIALIIAAVLVVFGGGAAAYYFAYVVPNKPENILKTALVNSFSAEKVKSVGFEGDVAVSAAEEGEIFAIEYSGAASQENGKLKQLTATASMDVVVTNVTMDVRTVDGETFYAKVGGLAGLPELLQASGDASAAMYAPLLSTIDEQWYEINQSLIEQVLGSSMSVSAGLSQADLQKIKDAYDQNQFLTVTETLADETISGVDSYHYKVAVDKTKLKAFVAAVQAANIQSLGVTTEMFDMLKSGIDSTDFSKYPIDVWIAKDSKLFTQFAFTAASEDGETLAVTLTLKDYNKELVVEVPEDAKSVLEVVNNFYQTFLGTDLPSDLPLEADGISL